MSKEIVTTFDLEETMLARTRLLIQLMGHKLSLDLAQQFSFSDIMDGCTRIDSAVLPEDCIKENNIQIELIQNGNFATYYAKLLDMTSIKVEQQTSEGEYIATGKVISPDILMYELAALLPCCWENSRDITSYPEDKMFAALSVEKLYADRKWALLDNFSGQEFSGMKWENVIKSLRVCIELPTRLDAGQKNLLVEPFVATRNLFATHEFGKAWALIEKCPALTSIMKLMHEREIVEDLGLEEYKIFMDDVQERYTHLEALAYRLGAQRMCIFLRFWRRGMCSMNELKQVDKCLSELDDQKLDYIFASYSSYLNILYKNRFKIIDLSSVSDDKGAVLAYAMSHKKKHFINLVDSNAELFSSLPQDSILFQQELYTSHFNLNELTVKDLSDCIWMKARNLCVCELQEGRTYTFPELKVLYSSSSLYIALYHILTSDSQDYRLRVLRQLQKRKLLDKVKKESLPDLALRLNIKPLYDWMRDDFKHTRGLTAEDAIQMLLHYEEIKPLLASIQCRVDVSLVLRNLKALKEFDSLEELKNNITKIDTDWEILVREMQLSTEFQLQYRENIIAFLCNDGAHIARCYLNCLEEKYQKAYQRVIKAELMGKLGELKYFEGDLQKELDMPLNRLVVNRWKQNLAIGKGNMEVREYDDFFSTMMLGVQPQRTCMSYIDGMYRVCLLSAFDSNKKVLYVTLDGHIVARAFLRLTKGRLTEKPSKSNSAFTFVDLEDVAGSREEDHCSEESLVLFLERPYFGGINPEGKYKAEKLLIDLARRKADELGTMLVLSTDYRVDKLEDFTQTRFNIFISKTKAGTQYLDSLDGEATVATEGSYKANTFLVCNK